MGIREAESNVVDRDGSTAIVKSLDLAVYLSMPLPHGPGLSVIDAVFLGRGRHEVFFHDPARRIRHHQMQFMNGVALGPYIVWAQQQRELKQTLRRLIKEKEDHARANARRGF